MKKRNERMTTVFSVCFDFNEQNHEKAHVYVFHINLKILSIINSSMEEATHKFTKINQVVMIAAAQGFLSSRKGES